MPSLQVGIAFFILQCLMYMAYSKIVQNNVRNLSSFIEDRKIAQLFSLFPSVSDPALSRTNRDLIELRLMYICKRLT